MPEISTLIVTASREAAEGLVAVLNQVDASHHTSVKRNLDGDTATWIVVATVAGQALPRVLDFLQSIIGGRRVRKIKLGVLEIEHPSKEDLERFRTMIDKALAKMDDSPGTSVPGAP